MQRLGRQSAAANVKVAAGAAGRAPPPPGPVQAAATVAQKRPAAAAAAVTADGEVCGGDAPVATPIVCATRPWHTLRPGSETACMLRALGVPSVGGGEDKGGAASGTSLVAAAAPVAAASSWIRDQQLRAAARSATASAAASANVSKPAPKPPRPQPPKNDAFSPPGSLDAPDCVKLGAAATSAAIPVPAAASNAACASAAPILPQPPLVTDLLSHGEGGSSKSGGAPSALAMSTRSGVGGGGFSPGSSARRLSRRASHTVPPPPDFADGARKEGEVKGGSRASERAPNDYAAAAGAGDAGVVDDEYDLEAQVSCVRCYWAPLATLVAFSCSQDPWGLAAKQRNGAEAYRKCK